MVFEDWIGKLEFVDLVSLIFRAKEGKNIMTIEEIYTIELEN